MTNISDDRLRELADKKRHFSTAVMDMWNGEPVDSGEVVSMATELLSLRTSPPPSGEAGEVTDEMVERAARAMEPMAFREEYTATDEFYDFELEGRAQALGRARAALVAALFPTIKEPTDGK